MHNKVIKITPDTLRRVQQVHVSGEKYGSRLCSLPIFGHLDRSGLPIGPEHLQAQRSLNISSNER